jgi:transglutaminase-like putative cysteine protease
MTRRRWRITVLAALATLAAVYPITSLFTSARWLPAAMLVIGLTAALGLLLRGLTRSRLLIVLVQLVVVLYVVLLRFTGETFSYGIPTARTVELANSLGLEAIETIQRSSAPAPLTDGVAFYLVAAVALIAVLVDAMAATWRAPAAAGLPLLTAYLITAANGNAASAVRYFVVPVALWLIMLHTTARATFGRWSTTSVSDVTGGESSSDNTSAMRALTGGAARLGALAVVAALLVPILVPHLPPRYLTDGLGRSTGSGGVGTVGFNDTIDLRNSLVNSDETAILRYTSTGPANVPLRALATSFYSRGEWRVAGRGGQGPDRPVPLPPQSDRREYVMTVSNNVLKAPRLAAPYPVVTPAIEGTAFRIDPVTRDIRVERTVESYQVTYADVNPPVSKLRAAGVPTSPDILADDLAIPDDAAELVEQWSDEVSAGATNDYDRAVAIQAHLRDTTRYTYSLDLGEAPTDESGQQLDPISAFQQTRRGYCTQFATAMIMLARAQGIPARMAIGFIPGTREGSSNIVRASDAHAWPELYFEGSGWLRFEPTASRSGPPAYSVPGLDSPTSGPSAPTGATAGTATQTTPDRRFQEGEAGSSTTTSWVDRWLTGSNLVILITVLVVVLGTFLMPLTAWIARTLRRRRAATRQDLVEIEWDALMSHFDDLGLAAPPGATLRSARERYITDGHLDDAHASAMRRVTATLERARYDRPERTTPEQTEELHRDIRSIRRQVSGTRSWTTRVRSFLWPTEGVSVWRGLMSRLGRILRRRQ